MKNQKGISLLSLIIIVVIIILGFNFFPLFYTTEQIAKETQKIIEDNWRQEGLSVTVLEDLVLTKKYGNEYSGIMKIMYYGKTIQLTGTVVYDGNYIQWQPDNQNLFYQLLDL